MREVRNPRQEIIELTLDAVELALERFQLVRLRIDFGHQRRCVLSSGFGLADLF